jgi:hypothetical protein
MHSRQAPVTSILNGAEWQQKMTTGMAFNDDAQKQSQSRKMDWGA